MLSNKLKVRFCEQIVINVGCSVAPPDPCAQFLVLRRVQHAVGEVIQVGSCTDYWKRTELIQALCRAFAWKFRWIRSPLKTPIRVFGATSSKTKFEPQYLRVGL